MKIKDLEKASGHWILARMGKRVLRPGGKELTIKLVESLNISSSDDIVEFAPGMGFTASLLLKHNPKSYAVNIELLEDIAVENVDFKIFDIHPYSKPIADENVIEQGSDMIKKSKRPLLLIGASANRGSVSDALTQFINKTGIYFFNTQMGKGVVDERHPLFLGTATLSSDDFIH